jgi:hypothetical protein
LPHFPALEEFDSAGFSKLIRQQQNSEKSGGIDLDDWSKYAEARNAKLSADKLAT